MANIAQAINQGTDRTTQNFEKLNAGMQQTVDQQRENIGDTMQMEAFVQKRQDTIDEKADIMLQVHGNMQRNIDKLRGKSDAATTPADKEAADAEILVATRKRDKYVSSLVLSNKSSLILGKSSFGKRLASLCHVAG